MDISGERKTTRSILMKQMLTQDELHSLEAVCTRNDPPKCAAACPIGMDGRAFLAALKKGDINEAATVLRKASPFINVISRLCHAECEKCCVLAEKGDGISMLALERFVARNAPPFKKPRFAPPKKKHDAAVIGSDLFAVASAYAFASKGYDTLLLSDAGAMSDILVSLGLDINEAKSDLKCFEGLRITFRSSDIRDSAQLVAIAEERDCVLASKDVPIAVAPNVMKCEASGDASYIIYSANSMMLTLERRAQGVTSDVGRKGGGVATRLYVDRNRIVPSRRANVGEISTIEEAKNEADRCISCECRECIDSCAFLRHFGRDPRTATREIYNNLSIAMGIHMANELINACALCSQCTVICPNGYDFTDLCLAARRTMVQTKKMPPSAHEFALLDMLHTNGEAHACYTAPDMEHPKYLFYPGCQMTGILPDTVRRVYRDLSSRLGGGVGILLSCCGAIAEWSGQEELANESVNNIVKEWEKLGRPIVIAACPTCKARLSSIEGMIVRFISDVLLEIGLPLSADDLGSFVLHDPCGARGDLEEQTSVRELLRQTGCEISEGKLSGDRSACCGYGGLVSFANPAVAREMTLAATPGDDSPMMTYCSACRDRFLRNGTKARHFLEAVYGAESDVPPDYSKRRSNRLKLKEELLGTDLSEAKMDFNVKFSADAEKQLDERLILRSDVLELLQSARESGMMIEDARDGSLTSSKRIGNVTVWARFQETDDGYFVESVYCHRMTIAEAMV